MITSLILVAGVQYLRSVPGSRGEALLVAMPVKGKWNVMTGGRTRITNYHHGAPESQNFAVDIIAVKEDETRGQIVFSPISGTVVRAVGRYREGDSGPAEGNIVILETADGVEIWLAHLEYDSVLVADGDFVQAGAELARCGATGSAENPHLHMHAQRGSLPVPLLLGERKRFAVRGDSIGE